jgi:predicted metal-dependent peptidase
VTAPLSEVERIDARTWMQAARVWTIERYPYLDTAVTSMLLVESPGLGTVAVDARWRLYYDPARTLQIQREHGSKAIDVLASDWVHEVMHLLRDHHGRWEDLAEPPGRHGLFNYAADAFVNADVADLELPILPTDITFEALPRKAGCTRTMTTEEVYGRLRPLSEASDACRDCGSGAGGGRRSWEEPLADDADDGSIGSADADVIREESARKIRAEGADVPPALREWAGAFLDPRVDWRQELRSVVSRRIGQLAGVTDYTYSRLARRRVPGFVLPGMAGPEPPRVAAIIDTSGSMSEDDLQACLSDLLGLVRAVSSDGPAITVMTVDHIVHDVVLVRRPADVPRLSIQGGGGTDMGVGLEALGQLAVPPAVVVVLTDGYTPWPTAAPDGLQSATVIAVLSEDETAVDVPSWIHAIPVS